MTKLNDKTVPRRNPDITWREEDQSIFIGSIDGRMLFSIEFVGADLWRLVDGKLNLKGILEQLAVIYDVDSDTLQSDTHEFLEELVTNGLILID